MVGRTGIKKDSKKLNLTNRYIEQEVVETHDRPRPEGTWNIEEE